VNTDDDGDDEKLGARYDMKEREKKRDEMMKMLQGIYI